MGGLGHLAIQYAKAMGLLVCAVDIDDGKLSHATQLGCDLAVNANAGDASALMKAKTGGGAHGVLIPTASLMAFKLGIGMTRKRGTCVLVGLPPGDFPVPLFDVVSNCITIHGSFVGTRLDMAESLGFAAQGKVKADIELQPLSSINEVLNRLKGGKVASRVVLNFAPTRPSIHTAVGAIWPKCDYDSAQSKQEHPKECSKLIAFRSRISGVVMSELNGLDSRYRVFPASSIAGDVTPISGDSPTARLRTGQGA